YDFTRFARPPGGSPAIGIRISGDSTTEKCRLWNALGGRRPGAPGPCPLLFLSQATTCGLCAGGIYSCITFHNLSDLPVLVDDKRRAVGDSHLGDQHAVQLGNLAIVIAQQG